MTKWKKLASQIFFSLLLPTIIAMAIVVFTTAGWLSADIRVWMAPVKQTMIDEELTNLRVHT